MRIIVATLVVLSLTITPVFAGQAERETRRNGRTGALIGALVGFGGSAVYFTTNEVCVNQFGDYTGKQVAAGCATPIALMIAGGGLIGYFIDRGRARPAESTVAPWTARRLAGHETWGRAVVPKLKATARSQQPVPRAYRNLFAPQQIR